MTTKPIVVHETYQQGGKEHDREGKQHVIMRTRCFDCDAVLSEMHYSCCGFSACGFARDPFAKPHECAPKASR